MFESYIASTIDRQVAQEIIDAVSGIISTMTNADKDAIIQITNKFPPGLGDFEQYTLHDLENNIENFHDIHPIDAMADMVEKVIIADNEDYWNSTDGRYAIFAMNKQGGHLFTTYLVKSEPCFVCYLPNKKVMKLVTPSLKKAVKAHRGQSLTRELGVGESKLLEYTPDLSDARSLKYNFNDLDYIAGKELATAIHGFLVSYPNLFPANTKIEIKKIFPKSFGAVVTCNINDLKNDTFHVASPALANAIQKIASGPISGYISIAFINDDKNYAKDSRSTIYMDASHASIVISDAGTPDTPDNGIVLKVPSLKAAIDSHRGVALTKDLGIDESRTSLDVVAAKEMIEEIKAVINAMDVDSTMNIDINNLSVNLSWVAGADQPSTVKYRESRLALIQYIADYIERMATSNIESFEEIIEITTPSKEFYTSLTGTQVLNVYLMWDKKKATCRFRAHNGKGYPVTFPHLQAAFDSHRGVALTKDLGL